MRTSQILFAALATFAAVVQSQSPVTVETGPITPAAVLPRAALAQPQIPEPTAGMGAPVVGDQEPEPEPEPEPEEEEETTTRRNSDDDKPTSTKKSDSSETGDSDASTTKGGKDDDEKTTSKKKTSESIRIPKTAQPGGVSIKYPAPTDGFQIYSIGATLTFAWNYTSLLVTPSRINVEAYCTSGSHYFTITKDAPGSLKSVTWDTGEQQANGATKLPVATYSLVIYDAAGSRTDPPEPGKLMPYRGANFGLYKTKPYVDWEHFDCPTCEKDSANALATDMALRMTVGMGVVAALTFTWFFANARA